MAMAGATLYHKRKTAREGCAFVWGTPPELFRPEYSEGKRR